jgi:predicted nucleic acid-binding protein
VIFVDTSALIDGTQEVGQWTEWSERALAAARATDRLVSNHVVFAELSPIYSSRSEVSVVLSALRIDLLALSEDAAFLSGRAHAAYKAAGGSRQSILADFLIGGHACALGAKLLTRDKRRMATYFPELELITPETDHG